MLIDLHVHTDLSPCSRLGVEETLFNARARGLDGVCITDHDTMDARFEIAEGVQDNGLLVIIGMEYATAEGDFLLFGPFEDLQTGLSAREVLALVHEAGGASIAAHPCRAARSVAEDIVADGLVHCLEVMNGRNTADENRCAHNWARRHGLPGVSGSDAHALNELGLTPTRFFAPLANRRELIAALRLGRCTPAAAPGAGRDSARSLKVPASLLHL
jgi:hypothetical protein